MRAGFFKSIIYIVLIFIIALSACTFGDKDDIISISSRNIYVAGHYNDQACYWVIGDYLSFRVDLPIPAGTIKPTAT